MAPRGKVAGIGSTVGIGEATLPTSEPAPVVAQRSPQLNSNFLVDLGYGDAHDPTAGFCEVVFPEFAIDATTEGAAAEPASRCLILRRGVTGAVDLYTWWDKARRGKAPLRRTVTVQLLAADHTTVVLTWYFRHARPISLSYSPLNAMQGAVLIESIALAFDTVEIR